MFKQVTETTQNSVYISLAKKEKKFDPLSYNLKLLLKPERLTTKKTAEVNPVYTPIAHHRSLVSHSASWEVKFGFLFLDFKTE